MPSPRKKLFNQLKLVFFTNLFLTVVVSAFAYSRSRKSQLYIKDIETLTVYNLKLSADLDRANNYITNVYVRLIHNLPGSSLDSLPPALASTFSSAATNNSSSVPSLDFSSYFEVDNRPYIRIRHKVYSVGDKILGERLNDITPDFVLLGSTFHKVK